jgi:hypothetical protein
MKLLLLSEEQSGPVGDGDRAAAVALVWHTLECVRRGGREQQEAAGRGRDMSRMWLHPKGSGRGNGRASLGAAADFL